MLKYKTLRAHMQEYQNVDFNPPVKYRFNSQVPKSINHIIHDSSPSSSRPLQPKTPSLSLKFYKSNPNLMLMDSSSTSTNRPSPRQLQGPRPTPLKVRKDSYKINKKPPTIPNNPNNPPPPQLHRPPLIIYTVSPKIIHTNPADFMTLVQRLTGPDSDSAPDPSIPSPSAAARFAAIEKPPPRKNSYVGGGINHIVDVEEDANGMLLDRPSSIPGILSPVPSSLQPISSSFFSPIASFDPGSLSFLNDLSPGPAFVAGGGNNNFITGSSNFLISPNNFLSAVPSPGSYWDLFNDL